MIWFGEFSKLKEGCILSHQGQIKPYHNNPKYQFQRSNETSYYKFRTLTLSTGRMYNAKKLNELELVFIEPSDQVEVCFVKEPVLKD